MKEQKWEEGLSVPSDEREHETTESQPVEDLFNPELSHVVNIIMQMRIYDALMALLYTKDPGLHGKLEGLHATGQFVAPPPAYDVQESMPDVTDE